MIGGNIKLRPYKEEGFTMEPVHARPNCYRCSFLRMYPAMIIGISIYIIASLPLSVHGMSLPPAGEELLPSSIPYVKTATISIDLHQEKNPNMKQKENETIYHHPHHPEPSLEIESNSFDSSPKISNNSSRPNSSSEFSPDVHDNFHSSKDGFVELLLRNNSTSKQLEINSTNHVTTDRFPTMQTRYTTITNATHSNKSNRGNDNNNVIMYNDNDNNNNNTKINDENNNNNDVDNGTNNVYDYNLLFESEHRQRNNNDNDNNNNPSRVDSDSNERIFSEESGSDADSNYVDTYLDYPVADMKISPPASSLSSASSSLSLSSSPLTWSAWLYSWIIPETDVTGSRSRSRRSSGDGEETSLTSEFIMVMNVPHLATSSNSSIDATILRLRHALAKEIPWTEEDIHVSELSFPASQIQFYFQDGDRNLVPVKLLMSNDLASRVSSHVPDLDFSHFEDGSASSMDEKSIWEKTYFPWAVAAASVAVILMLVVGVYICCRRKKVPEDPVDAEDGAVGVVVSHSIHYPSLKPELGEPTPVQPPDLQLGGFASPPGLTSPVLTQPIRIKGKGLLERRGSNASLTLDLNPCNDTGRWEGTPPKESTALEFLMSAGNRLSRRDLRNAVKNSKTLYEEFWEIPMNHTEKVCVAGSGVKNRYKTIIPNEHSRVILPDIDDDPLNSYINANYIRGYEGESKAYIATQGPMAHTILDFWRMVWFEKCAIVVMITKLKEKSKPKCENYLPEKSGQYGDVEVVIEKIVVKKGYVLRHITLRAYGESQSILHYWYTAWPDHKPPESPHMLLDLVKEVELRRFQTNGITSKGSVCVHCSAGIGRTGCFVGISIGIRQLREEHSVDALGIVCAMRIDRGGLIQTHEQYDFVHQALAAYERELGESSVQSITALTSESVTTP